MERQPRRPSTPDEVADRFGAALRAGDADAATALFSRDGCFVTPDATVIHGRPGILGFLRQLVALARDLTVEQRSMVIAGDVAVGRESWSLRLGGGNEIVSRTSHATIVLAQVEREWKLVVIDPWRA
jgi:ketosteroid isomerase-like protein